MRRATRELSPAVVAHSDPLSTASEAFRVLRTNLQFMGLDEPLTSILVTSASPGEGKSTNAANLAVAFAQAGVNVCLVDADLRRPTVAKLFGVENWAGLTTVIVGQGELDDALQPCQVPGLTLLTSGPIPPNPAELLGSERMTALLKRLEERFDMVIVDTPPVLAVTDAAVLAPKVGGVVLVVRSGQVPRQQVVRAKEALEAVRARLLGVVLGAVKQEGPEGYYYYYSYGTEQR
jgi:protein-tyrosine kinase